MKKNMYMITKAFPYGHGEDSFVKPEYPYLCDKFHVKIIAAELGETEGYVQDESIDSCIISKDQKLWDKLVSFLLFLTERDCYIEMAAIIKDKKCVLKRIYRALMFGTAAETFYRRLKKELGLNKNTNALFYFYWFDYKCFGLTMHKHKFPNIKIVARTHGYDLYDERELYGRQFFKMQMDNKIEKLIFAAEYARNYYLTRYCKLDGDKYPLHRLGVADKNITADDRRVEHKEEFLLLSCSNAISIKRVELIIDGLSYVDKDIRWIHIGGGNQLEKLKEKASVLLGSKKNIRYTFTDALSNDDVIRFYWKNYISCFITTTSTEGGSPVSVQEALSFGVPLIAVAIGELPCMVSENGILLPANPTGTEVGNAIMEMRNLYGTEQYFHMCEKSLTIFQEMFNASYNYKELVEEICTVG